MDCTILIVDWIKDSSWILKNHGKFFLCLQHFLIFIVLFFCAVKAPRPHQTLNLKSKRHYIYRGKWSTGPNNHQYICRPTSSQIDSSLQSNIWHETTLYKPWIKYMHDCIEVICFSSPSMKKPKRWHTQDIENIQNI